MGLSALTNLEVLQLGHNQLTDLPSLKLRALVHLRVLHLQSNELQRVDGLQDLSQLRELLLDRNKSETRSCPSLPYYRLPASPRPSSHLPSLPSPPTSPPSPLLPLLPLLSPRFRIALLFCIHSSFATPKSLKQLGSCVQSRRWIPPRSPPFTT